MILVLPTLALAYSGGPPDGMTGAPPSNNTCVQCHSTNPLNSGNGSFSIDGPTEYVPGQVYPITVTLQDPGQSRWGFEFTPLDKGTLQITDAVNTQSSASGGNGYVKHTSAGTHDDTPDGPVSWTFNWTAPAVDEGEIVFYAAGNAANSNNASSGDFIYAASFATQPATGLPAAAPRDFALLGAAPNPFNPATVLSYRMDQAGEARLEVYDLMGRLVETLAQGWQSAGEHQALWAGRDRNGRAAASGVYLARLEIKGQVQVARLLLVK
jgi:hypothetical protein